VECKAILLYCLQIISEQYIQQHRSGLQGMYNAILDFFPKHYTKLREITTGAGQGFVSVVDVRLRHLYNIDAFYCL